MSLLRSLNKRTLLYSFKSYYNAERGCSINKDHDLITSSIIVEDGRVLKELPVIVRKMKDIVTLYDISMKNNENKSLNPDELQNYNLIREEFKNCKNLREIFRMLSQCERVTGTVALAAMERLLDFEICEEAKTFNINSQKTSILDKLLTIILKAEDTQILLNTLNNVESLSDQYKYKLYEELLIRYTENKLSIEQICEFARFLQKNKMDPFYSDTINKLWSGLIQKEAEIDETNINLVYGIVSFLNSSRPTVLNLLEKKLTVLWWKMKVEQIEEILEIFLKQKTNQGLYILSRWTNLNIHLLNEEKLLNIVSKFTSLGYHDIQLERAIERYIKAKGINIKQYTLIVAILNHCREFHLRNSHILNGCTEFFAINYHRLPVIFIKPFIEPLGYLNFQPSNGIKFWSAVENILEMHITKIQPENLLDVLLSCIYLKKYPLNFINKIFNPQFLSKINQSVDCDRLRNKLKLIDTSMTFDCKDYKGPILPKDHWAKTVPYDGRLLRIINNMRKTLEVISGDPEAYSTQVLLPNVFSNELYILDILLHPKGLGSSIINMNLRADRKVCTAILIHLPEHYCGNSHLIGPQALRKRHIKYLGFPVVCLEYKVLMKLLMHTEQLENYIKCALKSAER